VRLVPKTDDGFEIRRLTAQSPTIDSKEASRESRRSAISCDDQVSALRGWPGQAGTGPAMTKKQRR
jgi:hypothetical protein